MSSELETRIGDWENRLTQLQGAIVEGGSKWRREAAEFGGAGWVKVSVRQGWCRGFSVRNLAGAISLCDVGGV